MSHEEILQCQLMLDTRQHISDTPEQYRRQTGFFGDAQPLSMEDEKWRRAEEAASVENDKNRRSSALPL